MERRSGRDVITRCDCNPLIGIEDLPFRASDIWNAGVARFGEQVLLLITIEELEGRYSLYRAASDDGDHFTVDAEPVMVRSEEAACCPYENVGIRDPRITPDEEGGFNIAYVADGDHGMRVGLARTTDFRSVERLGYVTQVDVKNGALFPRRIGGKNVLLTRPAEKASIWLWESDGLEFWGSGRVVMTPRNGYWDSNRIGAAAPPIEIDQGWLLMYYGEKGTSAGPLVRLGAAVLDRDDPSRVLARSNIPVLAPRERYERIGDVPNVVFSCGALLEDGELCLYYGASDSCICRGTVPLEDVLQICAESKGDF